MQRHRICSVCMFLTTFSSMLMMIYSRTGNPHNNNLIVPQKKDVTWHRMQILSMQLLQNDSWEEIYKLLPTPFVTSLPLFNLDFLFRWKCRERTHAFCHVNYAIYIKVNAHDMILSFDILPFFFFIRKLSKICYLLMPKNMKSSDYDFSI